MICPTETNLAPGAPTSNAPMLHRSAAWLPAAVARRMLDRMDTRLAGERALAQRERHGIALTRSARDVRSSFLWIYWDCVCIAIERRTGRRFRIPVPLRERRSA